MHIVLEERKKVMLYGQRGLLCYGNWGIPLYSYLGWMFPLLCIFVPVFLVPIRHREILRNSGIFLPLRGFLRRSRGISCIPAWWTPFVMSVGVVQRLDGRRVVLRATGTG